MASIEAISVVTVTYSDRLSTLFPMLTAVHAQGVRHAIVYCNGVTEEVRSRVIQFAQQLDIDVELPGADYNAGSAVGYSQGLACAFSRANTDSALLLDDDNIPEGDCISTLAVALEQSKAAAVCALRKDRPYLVAVANAGNADAMILRPGQVFNFDVRMTMSRTVRKIFRVGSARPSAEKIIAIPRAPYGGLLIPRHSYERVGGPNASMVLYADDLEFSERLAAAPGGLLLVADAFVDDAEESWNMNAKRQSAAARLANASPDFRLFYSVRNAVYLDFRRGGFSLWLLINSLFFLATTLSASLMRGRLKNAAVLIFAFIDGVRGHLGMHVRYPLPGGRTASAHVSVA